MGGTDALAVGFAVAAVVVGLGLMGYMVLSDAPPGRADGRTQAAPTLDVMLGGHEHAVRWRFESLIDETITIDVFSQRASGGHTTPTSWRHDLMTDALTLPPWTTAELPADSGATRYDAAIGWYVGDAAERRRDSRYVTVERTVD